MGIYIDPKRQETYVLKEDRDKPPGEQTAFKIRVLTAREYEMRKDLVRGTDAASFFKMGTWTLTTLRHGLVGIEGPGAPEFTTDTNGLVDNEVLDVLSPQTRDEVAGAIDRLNRIGPEDRFE